MRRRPLHVVAAFTRQRPGVSILLLIGASWLVSFEVLGNARLGGGDHPALTVFVILTFLSVAAVGSFLKPPSGPQPPDIYDDSNIG